MFNSEGVKQAIILVAGGGTRLRPLTDTIPKCLVEVNGVPILKNALRVFSKNGTKTVRIIVGHLADVVEKSITSRYEGMAIEFIHNDVFNSTNSMYSLYLGLEGIEGTTWVLEGDVFFEEKILKIPTCKDFSWFVDAGRSDLDGAHLTANGSNRAIRLEIIREKSLIRKDHCKSIGLLKLGDEGVVKLRNWLKQGIKEGKVNSYYDLIVAGHLKNHYIDLINVSGCKWYEIDSHDDLKNAEILFKKREYVA